MTLSRFATTLVSAVLLAALPAASAAAQCRVPVSSARSGGPGSLTVRGAGDGPAALARLCTERLAPPYLSEDSTALLKGITLERSQNAPLRRISTTFAKRFGTTASQAYALSSAEIDAAVADTSAAGRAEVRALFLTPAMQELRNQYALALRGALTPEQRPTFDTNLVALRRPGSGG